MEVRMSDEKLIKKALRLQFLMKLVLKLKSAKVGEERVVDTRHGKVRVLEYGLDLPEVKPLFVDLHGGGFVLGSADMDEPMCNYFREHTGAKIISIDYPKAPRNPYPIAIEAIYDVIKHYIDNAKSYKINPDNIGIGGHSAGGNLATVLCMLAKKKKEFSFQYQILDYPPCDMSIDAYERPNPKGSVNPKSFDMFNACYYGKNKEKAKTPYISPVYATKEQLSGLPSALLIIAGQDSLHEEGIRYKDLLNDAGVIVEFHEFSKSVHGFTYYKKPDAKIGWNIMVDFLKRHVG